MSLITVDQQPLTGKDVAAACRLSSEAGWNQTERDWRWMIAHGHAVGLFAPAGGLVATALVLPFDGDLAWIGMVLVAPAWRCRGLATRLVRSCAAYCEAAGRLPLLDATEAGRTVYEKAGFTDCYAISRWVRARAGGGAVSAGERPVALRALTEEVLPDLAAWDRLRFGAGRLQVLRYLRRSAPEWAVVAEEPGGGIAGYGLGRRGRLAAHLGPIVARDVDVARCVLQQALARIDGAVYVDAPDAQGAFIQALKDAGFTRRRGFMRMAKGDASGRGRPAQIYAIAGPELG